MNAADLARLELAKRAYKAAEPRDAEVQTGVRRARLWLGRPKPRRAWFSKGLVLVVLAIGSLAYAKPQAAGELVEKVFGRDDAAVSKRSKLGVTLAAPVEAGRAAFVQRPGGALLSHRDDDGRATAAGADGSQTAAAVQTAATVRTAAASKKPAGAPSAARPTAPTEAEHASTSQTKPTGAVTDWGRVGQALARGDSAAALSALGELADSDDPSTRDKADLGRAQLLMAHGEPEQACALARSLSHRRAGGRIERQAQLLLKGCAR